MDNKPKLCAKCESPLVQLSQIIKKSEKSEFTNTVTTYRCTNDTCQAEIDKRTADLEKQRLERLERSNQNKAAKQP